MTSSRSLATRAVMALLLMVGFYALALSISGALLWIPYAEMAYLGRIHPKLALGCLVAAGAILWAIVPRADRFDPPGPRLTRQNARGLFSVIDDVAKATSQAPPAEVYLLNDVNAWVTQRGGAMGVGSRRVMGVGLPLVAHLTPAELAAVIAHEFGHYVSGDVALGPWIYKTRAAVIRAVAATEDTWLARPFRAYAELFLKTTMAVSREQEFVADRTAARVAGAEAAASALDRVASLAPAYQHYLTSEVGPVVRNGFLPPVAAGFAHYLEQPTIAQFMASMATESRSGEAHGAYDTHPPMADRIAALKRLSPVAAAVVTAARVPALDRPDLHARALLGHALGEDALGRLKPITWDQVGERVYLQHWHEVARAQAPWLGARTVDDLPSGRQAYVRLGRSLVADPDPEAGTAADHSVAAASHVLTCSLGATLVRAGWALAPTGPGMSLEVVRGADRLDPGMVVMRLMEGQESDAGWRARCEVMGIAGLPLAPPPGERQAVAS